MTPQDEHMVAGRMIGASGVVTFCTCGLAFFAQYEGLDVPPETSAQRTDALNRADWLWKKHEATVSGP